jgi:methionyl aminopeptidase
MRHAGHIAMLAHEAIKNAIKPGITTKELDKIAYDVITKNGATPSFLNYNGYPASICASINEVVVHGIPSNKQVLKDGDIISIDIGTIYKGYHGDCARTWPVGKVSSDKLKLIEVTEQSFYEGLKFARPGNRLSDISHAIEMYAKQFNYGVVRDFTGHGIGSHLHEDPAIPNYGEAGHGPILRKGMTLAIEPMINLGTYRVKILNDGWTTITCDKLASAHYENSIVITDNGYEILTKIKEND